MFVIIHIGVNLLVLYNYYISMPTWTLIRCLCVYKWRIHIFASRRILTHGIYVPSSIAVQRDLTPFSSLTNSQIATTTNLLLPFFPLVLFLLCIGCRWLGVCVYLRARVGMCVCMRLCVIVCVCSCVRMCVCACVHFWVGVHIFMFVIISTGVNVLVFHNYCNIMHALVLF